LSSAAGQLSRQSSALLAPRPDLGWIHGTGSSIGQGSPTVLTDELLRLPGGEGQRVVVFHAEPDSPSDAALRLLADLIAEPRQTRRLRLPAKPQQTGRRIDLISLSASLP
jgi:hypothetical protein